MKKITLIFFTFLTVHFTLAVNSSTYGECLENLNCDPTQQCNLTFEMWDDADDTWDDAVLKLYADGVFVADLTGPANNAGHIFQDIAFCDGAEVTLVWNTADEGDWPDEINIRITDNLGQFLYELTQDADDAVGTTLFTYTMNCNVACLQPTAVAILANSFDSIQVGWNDSNAATQWDIYYVESGGPAPTSSSTFLQVTANPYTIDNLNPNQSYDIYIRTNCGGSAGVSNWVGPYIGSTVAQGDLCPDAVTLTASTIASLEHTYNGSLNGASGDPTIPASCGDADPDSYHDDDVWFTFVATATDHVVYVFNEVRQYGSGGIDFAIYEGTCNSLTEIACNNSNLFGPEGQTHLTNLTIGQTYYVRAFSTSSPSDYGTFNFDIAIFRYSLDVDESMNAQQIVNNVLVEDSDCFSPTNISWQNGKMFSANYNSIGVFTETYDSPLVMSSGIVISNGALVDNLSGNPRISGPSSFFNSTSPGTNSAWPGDNDLRVYLNQNLPINRPIREASFIEFDFVAPTDFLSIDYMYLSEDYGNYQCNQFFTDGMAFFLTDITAGTPLENIATIPGTNIPVTTQTLRDAQYFNGNTSGGDDPNCTSENETFFDVYNSDPYRLNSNPNGDIIYGETATNFRGQSKMLTAEATLIPGHTYHIKMVIGDRGDYGIDSAIFIRSASFSAGNIDIGDDFLMSNNTAICPNSTTTLSSSLPDNGTYNFQWFLDGNPITPDGTNATFEASVPGTYSLEATINNTTCSFTDDVIVEFYPSETFTANTLQECGSNGFAQFDLSENEVVIFSGVNAADYTIQGYYNSLVDAQAQTGAINTPTAYQNSVANTNETIVAAVQNNTTGCFAYVSFDIEVLDTPAVTNLIAVNSTVCENDNAVFNITGTANATVTYQINNGADQTVVLDGAGNASITVTNVTANVVLTLSNIVDNQMICSDTLTTTETVTFIATPQVISVTPVVSPIIAGETAQFVITGTANSIVTYEFNNEGTQTVTLDANGEATVSYTNAQVDIAIFTTNISETVNSCNATSILSDVVIVDQPSILPITTIIPQGISPNGDGLNDSFDLNSLDISSLIIYNRYGTEVFLKTNGYTNEWFGQDKNGNKLPTGTYYYALTFVDGTVKASWVYLNRK
jgi:gliding motility-associated-like protein